ncbi:hypothetical protein BpHYR1_040403, partial [Brachionus plicatilis]
MKTKESKKRLMLRKKYFNLKNESDKKINSFQSEMMHITDIWFFLNFLKENSKKFFHVNKKELLNIYS